MAARVREITGELSAATLLGLPDGSSFRLGVAGTSMEPVLHDGDELVGRRASSPSEWRLGDILVADVPDVGLVVHRLLWSGDGGVRLRGDGSGRMDRPVPPARVVGPIVEVRRAGRDARESATARRWAWARSLSAAGLHWAGVRMGLSRA